VRRCIARSAIASQNDHSIGACSGLCFNRFGHVIPSSRHCYGTTATLAARPVRLNFFQERLCERLDRVGQIANQPWPGLLLFCPGIITGLARYCLATPPAPTSAPTEPNSSRTQHRCDCQFGCTFDRDERNEHIDANALGLTFSLKYAPDQPAQCGDQRYRLLRCAALTCGSRLRAASTSAEERPSMIR
jgi:hypothetical protein